MARGVCAQLTDVVPLSLEFRAAKLPFVATHKVHKRMTNSLYETRGKRNCRLQRVSATTQPVSATAQQWAMQFSRQWAIQFTRQCWQITWRMSQQHLLQLILRRFNLRRILLRYAPTPTQADLAAEVRRGRTKKKPVPFDILNRSSFFHQPGGPHEPPPTTDQDNNLCCTCHHGRLHLRNKDRWQHAAHTQHMRHLTLFERSQTGSRIFQFAASLIGILPWPCWP